MLVRLMMSDCSKPVALSVLGAGSWGTAIAVLLARHGLQIKLWGRDAQHIAALQKDRVNSRYLPEVQFPECLSVTADLQQAVEGARDWIISVPSHAFTELLKQLKAFTREDTRIAWITKGIDPTSNQFFHELVPQYLGIHELAVLSGPSFAKEVGDKRPTAVTLACASKPFTRDLLTYFHSGVFRVYPTDDLVGVQLSGTVKNVLAIASGIADGLGYGANTRAALITRGLAEMTRLGLAMGAQRDTFAGLAGIGDLLLTCTDDQSRNRRFGLALGRGLTVNEAAESIGQVVEGLHNVAQVMALAAQYHIDMPICAGVDAVVNNKKPLHQVVQELLHRDVAVSPLSA